MWERVSDPSAPSVARTFLSASLCHRNVGGNSSGCKLDNDDPQYYLAVVVNGRPPTAACRLRFITRKTSTASTIRMTTPLVFFFLLRRRRGTGSSSRTVTVVRTLFAILASNPYADAARACVFLVTVKPLTNFLTPKISANRMREAPTPIPAPCCKPCV